MWQLWLAQQTSPSTDPVEWLQYGVLGLVLIAILTGWLWAKPAVDRILAANDRLRDERSKQTEALIAEVHGLRAEVHRLVEELARERPR